jgi:cell division protein FtsB
MNKKVSFGNKIFYSKILLVLGVFILIFFSFNLAKEIINRRDLKKEIGSLQGEINNLEGKNKELADLIKYFESIDFVEKEARTKLNLRKPGEKIIIIPDSNSPTSSQIQSQKTLNGLTDQMEVYGLSNRQKWWNYFFAVR